MSTLGQIYIKNSKNAISIILSSFALMLFLTRSIDNPSCRKSLEDSVVKGVEGWTLD